MFKMPHQVDLSLISSSHTGNICVKDKILTLEKSSMGICLTLGHDQWNKIQWNHLYTDINQTLLHQNNLFSASPCPFKCSCALSCPSLYGSGLINPADHYRANEGRRPALLRMNNNVNENRRVYDTQFWNRILHLSLTYVRTVICRSVRVHSCTYGEGGVRAEWDHILTLSDWRDGEERNMQVSPSSGQLMAMQNYKTCGKRNAIIKAQHTSTGFC